MAAFSSASPSATIAAALAAAMTEASATSERETNVNLAAPRSFALTAGESGKANRGLDCMAPREILELVALLVRERADINVKEVAGRQAPTLFEGLTPVEIALKLRDESLLGVLRGSTVDEALKLHVHVGEVQVSKLSDVDRSRVSCTLSTDSEPYMTRVPTPPVDESSIDLLLS